VSADQLTRRRCTDRLSWQR